MRSKRPFVRLLPGDVVRIPLGDGLHGYGRVLPKPLFEFLDCWDEGVALPIAVVLRCRSLFKVFVMWKLAARRWERVGRAPLDPSLTLPQPFFWQDTLNPERFEIEIAGVRRKATKEECVGLERLAVWDPQQIEDRLRDTKHGRPNKWIESLRLR